MRIGMITGEYPPMHGGVGAYTQILSHQIAHHGHEVMIFSRVATHDHHLPVTAHVQHWGYGALRAADRWAREHRLDIVNLQYQTAAYSMSPWLHFAPDALSVPVVTTFHDLRYPYLFPKAGKLRRWIVKRLARASEGVIVTNHEDDHQLRDIRQRHLIPIGSNILDPLPADFDPRPWREASGTADGDFLIGYFGLINRSKGIEILLHSIARLREEGIPARLVIIGGGAGSSDPTNAAYLREIEALIDSPGLRPFIHLTGYLDERSVGAYLTASDAVALPFTDGASYRRGTLMAAIRYRCPIVTTTPRVDIPPFYDNMLLCPPNDATDLAAALRRLYESPALRAELRENVANLSREFDWNLIALETVSFFRNILQ